jgi:nucleoside-diphosphate-sugar epimerase
MSVTHVILGTGPVGMAIMETLAAQPDAPHILMVNRSGKSPETLPAGVEVVASDMRDLAKVAQVTHGAAVVYTTAQPAYTRWAQEFPQLQAAILDGVARSGAKLVIAENLYMYADTDGAPLHEALPYAPHTRKGRVRAAMTEAAFAAHKAGKLQVTAGRASNFYGPRALGSSVGDRLFEGILKGKGAEIIGSADQPHTLTYIEDFGRALVTLGAHEQAFGRAWHVPNAPAMTMREFVAIISKILGQPVKLNVMGTMMMRIGGLFIPEAREGIEMMYEYVKPYRVSHSDYAQAFGEPFTPIETGLRTTLAWYQAHMPAHA